MSKSIDTSNWKRFKLDELFEIVPAKKINYKKLDLPDTPDDIFDLPAVTCTAYNNGISCYVPSTKASILKNMLSVAANGNAPAFYHSGRFTILQDAYALRFKNKELQSNEYLFLLVLLQKVLLKFDWSNKSGWQKVKQESILLPVDLDGKPNWEFMQETIKQTQSELFSMIKLYECLKNRANDTIIMGGGLPKPFILSHNTILQSFINEAIMQIANSLLESLPCQWGEFKIAELFNLELSKGDLQPKKLENGEIPLVSAGNFNNGIVMKIRGGDGKAQKFSKNVITIDMFGKAFYQNNDFYAVSHGRVNICVPKFELNFYTGLFLVSVLDKSLGVKFGFDKMCSQSKLEQESIFLPITSQQKPDFTLMQNFIKGIEQSHTEKLIKYYEFLQNNNGGGD